jgi:hypothetical protein
MLVELDPTVNPSVPEKPSAAVLDVWGELKLSCAWASWETETEYEPACAPLVVDATTAELDDDAAYDAYCVGSASALAADCSEDISEENWVMVWEALVMFDASFSMFVSGVVWIATSWLMIELSSIPDPSPRLERLIDEVMEEVFDMGAPGKNFPHEDARPSCLEERRGFSWRLAAYWPRIRLSASCGVWFACDRTDSPACASTCCCAS